MTPTCDPLPNYMQMFPDELLKAPAGPGGARVPAAPHPSPAGAGGQVTGLTCGGGISIAPPGGDAKHSPFAASG